MTGEEMERAIEFLLQSQAKSETRLEQLEMRMNQTDRQVAETSRQLQAYAETQSEFIQIVTTAMQGLAASQSRTDERLNDLAGLVERIITEGRNGHA
jgi:septal ring factor EnvC (AmiA/AmiB activator)